MRSVVKATSLMFETNLKKGYRNNVFAQNLTANDKIHAERKRKKDEGESASAKRTKVILKETNVK